MFCHHLVLPGSGRRCRWQPSPCPPAPYAIGDILWNFLGVYTGHRQKILLDEIFVTDKFHGKYHQPNKRPTNAADLFTPLMCQSHHKSQFINLGIHSIIFPDLVLNRGSDREMSVIGRGSADSHPTPHPWPQGAGGNFVYGGSTPCVTPILASSCCSLQTLASRRDN